MAVQPIAQQFGKGVDKVAQVDTAFEGHARHVLPKQVAGRAHHQATGAAVAGDVAHRHLGGNANAQAQADIGLDDVRINGFECHARLQLAHRKGVVDLGATGKGGVVGDQRFTRDVFEGDALLQAQRVADGQYQHVLPLVAGHGHQFGIVRQGLGGHANFGNLVDQHVRHLVRRALVQADVDLRVGLAQLGDRLGQHIARLGVGGGNGQGAAVLRAVLLANALEVAQLAHDQVDALEHVLPGLGHALEPLAVAGEDLHAQLFFQLDDGLGNAGLRGVQGLGGFGQVQVAPNGLLHEAELV